MVPGLRGEVRQIEGNAGCYIFRLSKCEGYGRCYIFSHIHHPSLRMQESFLLRLCTSDKIYYVNLCIRIYPRVPGDHGRPRREPRVKRFRLAPKDPFPPGLSGENGLRGKFRCRTFVQPERLPLGPARTPRIRKPPPRRTAARRSTPPCPPGTGEGRASNGDPPHQPKNQSRLQRGNKLNRLFSSKGAKAAKKIKVFNLASVAFVA
jgi:hypothetical protein